MPQTAKLTTKSASAPKSKTKTTRRSSSLIVLYSLALLLAVSSALPAYIQSNFLGQYISLQNIGYVMMAANLLSLVSILLFPSLIKRLTNYFTTRIMLTAYGASLLGLTTANDAILAVASLIIFMISSNLIWINMDILIESFTKKNSTGRTRTTYFTFINAGWIVSPLLSAYLIEKGEYTLSFLVAGFLVIPIFLIFHYRAHDYNHEVQYERKDMLPTMKRMWQDRNRRHIFFISFLLQLFYSSAIIYIPFHLLHNLGMEYSVLGPIFSLMLVPFLVIEIPAGIIADKYWGEKEMLISGMIIIAVSLFLFYYIDTPSALIWAGALFLSRVGAALVEAMRESYFFKIVKAEEIMDINIFRTTTPLGYIAASALAVILLRFLPLQHLFLFLSIVMLLGLTSAAQLRDTK